MMVCLSVIMSYLHDNNNSTTNIFTGYTLQELITAFIILCYHGINVRSEVCHD